MHDTTTKFSVWHIHNYIDLNAQAKLHQCNHIMYYEKIKYRHCTNNCQKLSSDQLTIIPLEGFVFFFHAQQKKIVRLTLKYLTAWQILLNQPIGLFF